MSALATGLMLSGHGNHSGVRVWKRNYGLGMVRVRQLKHFVWEIGEYCGWFIHSLHWELTMLLDILKCRIVQYGWTSEGNCTVLEKIKMTGHLKMKWWMTPPKVLNVWLTATLTVISVRSANNRQIPSPVSESQSNSTDFKDGLYSSWTSGFCWPCDLPSCLAVCRSVLQSSHFKSMVGAVTGAKEHTFDVVNYSL